MRGGLERGRAAVGIAVAQLGHYRVRTLLAVLGVAVAVLLVVVLGGLGYGIVTTGDEAITWIDYDLWASGGPVAISPGAVGGVENPVLNAHAVSTELESRPDVRAAQALGFQTVYVSPDGEEFETIVGLGIGGNASRIRVGRGPGFQRSDVHYANGTYEGPMTHEIVVGERTAERYNVSVGDRLHVGATLATARDNEFTVVGTTRTVRTFLGVPAVAMHLAELQEVSGTTGTDPASLIAIDLASGVDGRAVQRDIQRAHPDLDVRTNDQQVRAIVGGHATIIAAAVTLVVLAVVVGIALVVNVLALLVYQQRDQLAALKAAGVSGRTLVGVVAVQGGLTGALGGLAGVALAPVGVALVNALVGEVTGFARLVRTPPWLLAVGLCLAVAMGLCGAIVAGWRVTRLSPLAHVR